MAVAVSAEQQADTFVHSPHKLLWINTYHVFDAAMPFGGYKESGWGREMGHQCSTTTSRPSRS